MSPPFQLHSNTGSYFDMNHHRVDVLPNQFGMPTPPYSPDEPFQQKELSSRFKLPKWCRRTQPTRSPTFLALQRPSQDSMRGEARETVRSIRPQDITSAPRRPRAVRQMTEPFPLVLPASPPLSQLDSGYESVTTKRLHPPPLNLRTLRTSRSEQHLQSRIPAHPALLPSPVFSNSDVPRITRDSFFPFRNPRLGATTLPEPEPEATPQDGPTPEDIISSYLDEQDEQDSLKGDFTQETIVDDIKMTEIHVIEPFSPCSMMPLEMPKLTGKLKKRPRPDTPSSGEWLNGKLKYCEQWVAGVEEWSEQRAEKAERPAKARQRQAQVVQQSPKQFAWLGDGQKSPITYVTMTYGEKPKMVTISRPTTMFSESPVKPEPVQEVKRPATPPQPLAETSHFSPWESPPDTLKQASDVLMEDAEPRAKVVPPVRPPSRSPSSRDGGSVVDQALDESGSELANFHISSEKRCRPAKSHRSFASARTLINNGRPLRTSRSSASVRQTYRLHDPSPVPPSPALHTGWDRVHDLERIIERLEQGLNDTTAEVLRLDSPVILEMRNSNSLDEVHLANMCQIFSQASTLLLSSLCAAIIAHGYISKVTCASEADLSAERKRKLSAESLNGGLDCIPAKARATLGIHLPDVTEVQLHERVLRRRALLVGVSLNLWVQKLIETMRGSSDEFFRKALVVIVKNVEENCC